MKMQQASPSRKDKREGDDMSPEINAKDFKILDDEAIKINIIT
jgi:hypothetical protein